LSGDNFWADCTKITSLTPDPIFFRKIFFRSVTLIVEDIQDIIFPNYSPPAVFQAISLFTGGSGSLRVMTAAAKTKAVDTHKQPTSP
jgi:hypothetical protein